MSRYCGEMDAKPILLAAEHWRVHALQMGGSVFSDASLCGLDTLAAIEKYYVNSLLDEEDTFLEKLRNQMAPAPPEAKQLLLALHERCADVVGIGIANHRFHIAANAGRRTVARFWFVRCAVNLVELRVIHAISKCLFDGCQIRLVRVSRDLWASNDVLCEIANEFVCPALVTATD